MDIKEEKKPVTVPCPRCKNPVHKKDGWICKGCRYDIIRELGKMYARGYVDMRRRSGRM